MASAEREPITGVWGLRPQRSPGPWSGIQGGEAPEAGNFYIQSPSAFPALFLWHFALVQRLQISVNIQHSENCTGRRKL